MRNDPYSRRPARSMSFRSMGGWPALAILAIVIVAALYFTLGRQDRAAKLRLGSGTAQAMWDGTHTATAPAREKLAEAPAGR